MSEQVKQDILLESGTNELEIIEFYVGGQPLGINVQKLQEIISYDPSTLTSIPGSPPAMLGVLLLRGKTIPLIDLKTHLRQRNPDEANENDKPVVMVCEFNHRINSFLVDGVNQIHRISWGDVQPLAEFVDQHGPRFTGSVNISGREILMLDLENVVGEFDPESVIGRQDAQEEEPLNFSERRAGKKILMAEDSSIIRSNLEKVLRKAGFDGLESFVDGKSCYHRVLELRQQAEESGDDLSAHLHMLISDIEMPNMDGLTLCKKLKEELNCKDIPVLLFSSLINPPMEVKCDSVGADGYAAKPELGKLVKMMDDFLKIRY